jgi:hypothetical protein
MKAKSINTAALLLKTLLLVGFIIIIVMSGIAQTTRYRIGGGDYDVKDGNYWALPATPTTPIGGTIEWAANDIMIINANSGTGPIGLFFPSTSEIAKLSISDGKTVNIDRIDVSAVIKLSGSTPIEITSGSLKLNNSDITLNITPASGTSSANITGSIVTGGGTNTGLVIGPKATLTTSSTIRGSSITSSISSITISGTLNTTNYINSATFQIENGGKFKTSYTGTEGWWNSTTAPSSGYIQGTVEYSRTSAQNISAPFTYDTVIFSGNGSIKTIMPLNNMSCTGTLTINSGVSVVVSTASSLKVDGTITNSNGTSGLVLKSGLYTYTDESENEITEVRTASLMHNTNSISATVERYIGDDLFGVNDQRWHFLSSPVVNQKIWPEFAPDPGEDMTWGAYNAGSPYNWDFYYYNPKALTASELYWVNLRKPDGSYNDGADMATGSLAGYSAAVPTFRSGRGYLVAYAPGWYPDESPVTHFFKGTLHNGSLNVPLVSMTGNTYNLIGNPYPSAIDWKATEGWTRTSLEQNGDGYDYWIYNDVAGTYGAFNSSGTSGTNGVTRYIAPGQAFFVKARSSNDLSMTNSVRIINTQPWLKNINTNDNSFVLKITSSANTYSDEMIVDFNEDYTGGGSDKFWSFYTVAPEIYSVKEGNNYSIDRYNTLTDDMKVNIAAKTGVAATYTITATNIADFTLRDKVYLLDMKTGVKTNLKQTPSYSFAGTPDDDRNRFQLIFGTSIGTDEETVSDFTIYASDNIIYIRNDKANEPYTVMVSNMLGQIITRTQLAGNTLNQIELKRVPGVYVVTVYSEGKLYSRKVVVK